MVQIPFFRQSFSNLKENLIFDIIVDNGFGHARVDILLCASHHSYYVMPALRSIKVSDQIINKSALKNKSNIKVKSRRRSHSVPRCRWTEECLDGMYDFSKLQSSRVTPSSSMSKQQQHPTNSYNDNPKKMKLIDSPPRRPNRLSLTSTNETSLFALDEAMSIHHHMDN